MYGKIFASIYEGTLADDWRALVTFQQLIVLCGPDGVVDMTPRALSARTGIPLDIILAGIEALEKPDPDSRTPDLDGRRIERLDDHRTWGWRLVNHQKYRQMVSQEEKREADRVRIAKKRRSSRPVADSRDLSLPVANVANVAHTEAEAEAITPCVEFETLCGEFETLWKVFPRKVSKGRAEKTFAKLKPSAALVERMVAAIGVAAQSEQWRKDGGKFIPHLSTWLNDRGWEDEAQAPPVNGTYVQPEWMRGMV